jgi:hypothetical protein
VPHLLDIKRRGKLPFDMSYSYSYSYSYLIIYLIINVYHIIQLQLEVTTLLLGKEVT